jgi:hypothetical protein
LQRNPIFLTSEYDYDVAVRRLLGIDVDGCPYGVFFDLEANAWVGRSIAAARCPLRFCAWAGCEGRA